MWHGVARIFIHRGLLYINFSHIGSYIETYIALEHLGGQLFRAVDAHIPIVYCGPTH